MVNYVYSKGGEKMLVKNHIAKLNDNNCKNIINLMNQGIEIIDAFKIECKRTKNNFNKLNGIEIRDDKYYWIFSLLNMELQSLS